MTTKESTDIVPMEFREIEPDPAPVPAATKRSPNRRARTKRPNQIRHTKQARKNWLDSFNSYGDETRATDSIRYSFDTVRKWKRDIPEFKAAADLIAAHWRDRNYSALANLDGKAIQSLERMIEDTDDKRGSADIAYKVLKGAGYFREPTVPMGPPGSTIMSEKHERTVVVNRDAPEEQ